MTKIISYQRPENLEEALSLISQDKHVPLAGGTQLNTNEDTEPLHLVDLQSLALKGIDSSNGKLKIPILFTSEPAGVLGFQLLMKELTHRIAIHSILVLKL